MKFLQFNLKHSLTLILLSALAVTIWLKLRQPPSQDQLDTSLAKAVMAGDLKAVDLALSKGAEIRSCLDLAIHNGDNAMIDLLLAYGAPAQMSVPTVWSTRDERLIDRFIKLGVLPPWESIKGVIEDGEVELVSKLLPHVSLIPDPATMYQSKQGLEEKWTQLFLYSIGAPEDRRSELIDVLIVAHPEPCLPAQQAAVWYGKSDVILQLKSHGYPYGLPEMIVLGKLDEIRSFLAENPQAIQQRVDSPEVKGARLLTLALSRRQFAISHLLLDAGAPTDGTDDQRDLAITMAIEAADVELLQRILERSKGWYDPNKYAMRQSGRLSAIEGMLLNSIGKPEMMKVLLDAGFPLNRDYGFELAYAVNSLHECKADQAAKQIEVIRMLRDAGAARFSDSSHRDSIDEHCKVLFEVDSLDELIETKSLRKKPQLAGPLP